MLITKISPLTGKSNSMELDITEEHLKRWRNGEFIQRVMPHLSDNEREFLITGYTKEDWDTLFPEEEEDLDNSEPAF